MKKPIISPNFTIEDIHKIREYNYENIVIAGMVCFTAGIVAYMLNDVMNLVDNAVNVWKSAGNEEIKQVKLKQLIGMIL